MQKITYFLLILAIYACNTGDKKPAVITGSEQNAVYYRDVFASESGDVPGNIYADTLEFVELVQQGDIGLFYVRRANQLKALAVENPVAAQFGFLRGDIVSIQWKRDSIWIEGNGSAPEVTEYLVGATKIRDGAVSGFNQKHAKPIKAEYHEQYNFTPQFVKNMRNIVEEYLAGTVDPVFRGWLTDTAANIVFSIEEGQKEGRFYNILGIRKAEEAEPVKWLFVDVDNHQVYELYAPSDSLVPAR